MSKPVNVPLLDLKIQYAALRKEIEPAVLAAMEQAAYIMGPDIAALEKEVAAYLNCKHAIGCANGSDALVLALMALGIKPGDEVICPSYTFFATGGAVARVNAKPVYVDIDPVTYNVCPKHLREVAKKCTNLKAIIPVHLYGQAADMDGILAVAREFNVPVIEDSAQAIGTKDNTGAFVGTRGTIATWSFFPSKNLGAFGDGGLLTTEDDKLSDLLGILRVHGGKPKYYHKVIGMNSRLDTIQAVILRIKLRHLDAWHAGRQRNADFYDAAFTALGAKSSASPLSTGGTQLRFPARPAAPARHIYNQYVIRVPAAHRDALRDHLKNDNIGTEIYYPVPLHQQECFAYLGYKLGSLPQTESAALETLALPIYPELTTEQLQHVVDSIKTYLTTHGLTGAASVTTTVRTPVGAGR